MTASGLITPSLMGRLTISLMHPQIKMDDQPFRSWFTTVIPNASLTLHLDDFAKEHAQEIADSLICIQKPDAPMISPEKRGIIEYAQERDVGINLTVIRYYDIRADLIMYRFDTEYLNSTVTRNFA